MKTHETLVFKLLCEENDVKLINTPRLAFQIMSFVYKLKAKFSEICGSNRKIRKVFNELMIKSPPYACKILASEFVHRKDYMAILKDNQLSDPHPKWTEYENEADFKQPLGTLFPTKKGMVAIIYCQ